MKTLTIKINDSGALKALHALEEKGLIKIVTLPSLSGKAANMLAFEAWISDAENSRSMGLKEAKSKWASKRKQLKKLTP